MTGNFPLILYMSCVSFLQVTGSLSDGVGILTVDQRHERVRRQIRGEAASSSGQLLAGIKGLGHGIVGGFTSVVSQTYYGAKDDGFEVIFLSEC